MLHSSTNIRLGLHISQVRSHMRQGQIRKLPQPPQSRMQHPQQVLGPNASAYLLFLHSCSPQPPTPSPMPARFTHSSGCAFPCSLCSQFDQDDCEDLKKYMVRLN